MKISEMAELVRDRISTTEIAPNAYISTDSMIPNFGGVKRASSVPVGTAIVYRAGDILFSNIRPYFRKIWLADRSGACNADVLCIRAKPEKCLPAFLYYILATENFIADYLKGCKGAKMPRGEITRLLDYEVSLPSLPVQRRIAGVLGAMDEKIEVNRRKIAELEALAKTVYDYWFVQFDFPDAHGRPYRSSGGKMTWNASLKREVPDGWEVGKLETVFDVCSGCDHKHLPDGRYPVLGSGGVMRYAAEYLYDKESVLIPRKGTLNNVMFMQEPFWTVDTMFYTRPRRKWMMKYAYMTIKDFDFARLNTGTGVPSMTASIINRISIPIPPQDVVQKFDAFLTGLFDGIETSRRQIRELTLQRDALLPLLMNGQVEVA